MAALHDFKEMSMVLRALSEWRSGQDTAGDARDDQGVRLEEELKGEEEFEEELKGEEFEEELKGEEFEEELKGEEEFEEELKGEVEFEEELKGEEEPGEELKGKEEPGEQLKEEVEFEEELKEEPEEEQDQEEAKGEEAQKVIWAEAGPECEEDVPDHKGTTGRQLRKDGIDALCAAFVRERKMVKRKGGTIRKTSATLHGVQVERISPQKRRSPSQLYGEKDREITSIKLVFERNKCTLYKLEAGFSTKLGGFRADHFTILKNGFKMTLDTEMTPDSVDRSERPEEEAEEASVVIVTLPQEHQKE
ncbi:FK506-binding protein 4-like [Penaeus indicus]|uniref:FK506-binding protein 4-like n=1 Tax=Penaeus indicus TaxID=29960 RepID=UPI00300C8108